MSLSADLLRRLRLSVVASRSTFHHGMSRDGLHKALSAEGNPTWSTILKVTNALGLRFELHAAPDVVA
jgi:probable addiction module antidote protein